MLLQRGSNLVSFQFSVYNNVEESNLKMNNISRKAERKFARKPIPPAITALSPSSQEHANTASNSKILRINHNVVNMVVLASQKHNQDDLMELLFTNEKSIPTETSKKLSTSIENSALSKNIFLEYSPDSMFDSPARSETLNSSEMLISGHGQSAGKGEISTNLGSNYFTFQKGSEPKITRFPNARVSQFDLLGKPQSSLMLTSITVDSSSFRANYCFQSSARATLLEQKQLFKAESESLISRIRRLFKKEPLFLFKFYSEVMVEFENIRLRAFLMMNAIKYSTAEILSLEEGMNKALDMCRGEEIIDFMFFTLQEEEMLNINLSGSDVASLVSAFQSNFWKALAPIFQLQHLRSNVLEFEIQRIEEFLYKLL